MSAFLGTGVLARLIARRDRTRMVIWIVMIAGLIVTTASSFRTLYPTVEGRQEFGAGILANPTLRALDGPLFDSSSVGGLTAWRYGGIGAVLAALMSVLTVIRHTRAEEESGRTELVGAGVVGRLAPLASALLVATAADLAIGIVATLGLTGIGLGFTGSLTLGLATASAGIAFAAVAAVAAQLPEGARAANGIACGALGAAFLARALGDGSGTGGPRWLSWLSPIGWAQQVRPYAGERWWVFALPVVFACVLVTIAGTLVGRRDVGAGLVAGRLGPAVAGAGLNSAFALAWRLRRGSILGWSMGFAVTGFAIGGSANGIGDLLASSSRLEDVIHRMGAGGITDAYFSAVMGLWGLVVSAYAIQAVLRMRVEETSRRVEPLLATPLGRLRWAGGHLVVALAGTVVLLVVAGGGAGLAYGAATGDIAGQVPRLIGATLAQVPAAAVLAGIAVALFGLVPRATGLAWAALGVFAVLGQVGPLLRLGQTVMDISPFTHTPRVPGAALSATPLVVLTLLAIGLVTLGLVALRRRDIG